jgi:tRNA A37 threonylcarbamoyladenosine dehydratase
MSSSQNILSAFNDHFIEFLNDIQLVFPDDKDVNTAKNSLLAIRKANPRLIIKIWNVFIVGKYKDQIEAGNLDFFIDKDYSTDFSDSENYDTIIEAIDRLRYPVKCMSKENQDKSMKYIQNLTKLSSIYESTMK